MLPKEEKINKKVDNDQPGLFDKENEKDRISKKRKFVYIAMFLTIGLSVSFKIFNSLKNNPFPTPKFPTFNFNNPISKTSNFILPKEIDSTWSIFFKKIDSDLIIYEKNKDLIFNDQNLESILDQVNQNNFVNNSLYTSSLPEGFKIKELISENNNNFSYFSKIITPNQELFLIIKISDSKDLIKAKKLIPNVVDQLYWYSLQK